MRPALALAASMRTAAPSIRARSPSSTVTIAPPSLRGGSIVAATCQPARHCAPLGLRGVRSPRAGNGRLSGDEEVMAAQKGARLAATVVPGPG
jgi:hypothetical protein